MKNSFENPFEPENPKIQDCPPCGGSGKVNGKTCSLCGGKGTIPVKK